MQDKVLLGNWYLMERWSWLALKVEVRKYLVAKSEGKRTLRKPSRRWQNNIKINISEIRYEDMDLIQMALLSANVGLEVWKPPTFSMCNQKPRTQPKTVVDKIAGVEELPYSLSL
jgi:hypothetical protein